MKVAIFGRTINPDFKPYITEFFNQLHNRGSQVLIFRPFYDFLIEQQMCDPEYDSLFDTAMEAPNDVNFLISIGGDGTFLESIQYLKNYKIPVIGLNSGRLGFLANISKDEISEAVDAIFSGNFDLEERTMLELRTKGNQPAQVSYALNDITIQKRDAVMISVKVHLDDEYLNTYWTDGLIISTPTGSTAYSLSVGGPILTPGSRNFVLAPIASHNLSVRPIVISDSHEIRLEVSSRSGKFLLTADNRTTESMAKGEVISIVIAPYRLRMIKLPFNNFYTTLRNKLMWGMDKRN